MKNLKYKLFYNLCSVRHINSAMIFAVENNIINSKIKIIEANYRPKIKPMEINLLSNNHLSNIKNALSKLKAEKDPQTIAKYLRIHELIRNS